MLALAPATTLQLGTQRIPVLYGQMKKIYSYSLPEITHSCHFNECPSVKVYGTEIDEISIGVHTAASEMMFLPCKKV